MLSRRLDPLCGDMGHIRGPGCVMVPTQETRPARSFEELAFLPQIGEVLSTSSLLTVLIRTTGCHWRPRGYDGPPSLSADRSLSKHMDERYPVLDGNRHDRVIDGHLCGSIL